MSTIEQLQLIEDLFQAALERPPDQRASFIAQACPNDDLVAAEILALLAAHAQTAGPLDAPPCQFASGTDDSPAADRNLLPPGKVISHYRVIDLLGKGGMGEVYLAEDVKHNRKVALKLLPESLNAPPDHLKRFAREARALLALNHPNIITIYEVGEDSGIQYIVTELVEGQTLRKQFTGSRVDPATALDITIQIAGALSVAHDSGVVHRDIKPENVMLRSDGIVKVLDFGLAKLHKKMTTGSDQSISIPGMIVGTPAYMSPEQACGQETDTRSDIFSLGVILYEMLTGRLPFRGLKLNNIFSAILSAQPESLTIYVDGCPPAVQAVVDQMLAKDPVQRYASAQELLRDLKSARRSLVGGEDPESRPASPEPEPPPAVRETQPTIFTSLVLRSASFGKGVLTSGRRLLRLAEPGRPFYAGIIILLIITGAKFLWGDERTENKTGQAVIDSLAVLPFEGSGSGVDYLSDNLTDGLIDNLSRTPNLRVIARDSIVQYKGKEIDASVVGSTLNVKAILTGKVRQQGNTISIETALVDASDRRVIWSHEYRKPTSDMLSVQDEFVREAASSLRTRLKLAGPGTPPQQYNLAAFDLYVRGRWHWNKRSTEGRIEAIKFFEQAIDIDQKFALAYAGLADAYVLNRASSPRESYLRTNAAVTKALEYDNTLAEAHTTLGFIKSHFEKDWDRADEEFRKAFELKPSYATAHHWYASSLLARGRFEEAKTELKRAQELDPLSPMINTDFALYYIYTRQYDQAESYLKRMSDVFPSFFAARMYLGSTYLHTGRRDEAIEQYEKALSLAKGHTMILALLGYTYGVSGRKAEAQAILKQLESIADREYVRAYRFAIIYLGLGDRDACFEWLNKSIDELEFLIADLNVNPLWDDLKRDPRFGGLLGKLNFTTK